MLTSLLFDNPLAFLILAISLVVAITAHEFSHAWMAETLGDPTPRLSGRLTLNPLSHLDPIGTLALLIAGFGWGKPVPIDPFNLRSPRKDSALISFAGPGSNLILAALLALLIRMSPFGLSPLLTIIIQQIIILNVGLAIFNLLPVGPLDGAKILLGLLPYEQANQVEQALEQYGLILLIFVLFPLFGGNSLAGIIITPIMKLLLTVLLPA